MPRGPNPMKRKLKQTEFYCVSCRKPVSVHADDICFKDAKSSKRRKIPMLKAYCSKCDCNLNKFVKASSAGDMRRKYGRC